MRIFIFSISLTLFQVSCGVPLSSIKQQVLDKQGGIIDKMRKDEAGYYKWCRDDEKNIPIDCAPYEVGRSIDDDAISQGASWTLYNSNCPKENEYDLDDVLDENVPTGTCTFKNVYTRFFVHGFQPAGTALGQCSEACADFIDAYRESPRTGSDWQFVCIDWCSLAGVWFGDSLNEGIYDKNAKRSIDIGKYFGDKLIGLALFANLDGTDFQIVGHSLGAHFAGTMARTFNAGWHGNDVAKVTALDPAGPVFVQNGWGLKAHMIKKGDASFVQIIHTNGGMNPKAVSLYIRLGDLHQLGDVDIYVNGGERQPCVATNPAKLSCSHAKAIPYYIESIKDDLPMAHQCKSVDKCSGSNRKLWGGAQIQMGEWAEPEHHDNLYHQNLHCWSKDVGCVWSLGTCDACCQNQYYWTWKTYKCNVDEYS